MSVHVWSVCRVLYYIITMAMDYAATTTLDIILQQRVHIYNLVKLCFWNFQTLSIVVFWVVTPCSLITVFQRFGGGD